MSESHVDGNPGAGRSLGGTESQRLGGVQTLGKVGRKQVVGRGQLFPVPLHRGFGLGGRTGRSRSTALAAVREGQALATRPSRRSLAGRGSFARLAAAFLGLGLGWRLSHASGLIPLRAMPLRTTRRADARRPTEHQHGNHHDPSRPCSAGSAHHRSPHGWVDQIDLSRPSRIIREDRYVGSPVLRKSSILTRRTVKPGTRRPRRSGSPSSYLHYSLNLTGVFLEFLLTEGLGQRSTISLSNKVSPYYRFFSTHARHNAD
jgi:hypothetical protein